MQKSSFFITCRTSAAFFVSSQNLPPKRITKSKIASKSAQKQLFFFDFSTYFYLNYLPKCILGFLPCFISCFCHFSCFIFSPIAVNLNKYSHFTHFDAPDQLQRAQTLQKSTQKASAASSEHSFKYICPHIICKLTQKTEKTKKNAKNAGILGKTK